MSTPPTTTTATTTVTTISNRSDVNIDPNFAAIATGTVSSISSVIPISSTATTTTTATTTATATNNTNTNTNDSSSNSNINDTTSVSVVATQNTNRTDQDSDDENEQEVETNETINDGVIIATNTNTSSTTRKEQQEQQQQQQQLLLLVTPNGDEINAKNTLQSFDVVDGVASNNETDVSNENTTSKSTSKTTVPPPPTTTNNNNKVDQFLQTPNGEEINAKNTLQSFDNDNNTPHVDRKLATNIETIPVRSNNEGGGNDDTVHVVNRSNEDTVNVPPATMNVQAMAVVPTYGDVVVDAQPVYSIVGGTDDINTTIVSNERPWWKKVSFKTYTIIVGIIIIIVGIVVGISVYFGTNATSNLLPSSTPTVSPIIAVADGNGTTNLPTYAPTTLTKTEAMTTYINSITLLDRNISIDGVTPEDIALQWMINDDPIFNTTESWLPIASFIETNNNTTTTNSDTFTSIEQFVFIQRYALLTFWFQQVDNTTGTFQRTWTVINQWLVERNECDWYGIKCFTRLIDGINDEVDVVAEMVFIDNNITGTISADLGLLRWIRHVSFPGQIYSSERWLSSNSLVGTLPSTIGQWTTLTYFDVSYNGLSGTLPSTIGQWTALTLFDISYNSLDGTLPSTIGQWTALTYFDVSVNDSSEKFMLRGTLPSTVGQWIALTHFDVSYSPFLNGTLPSTLGQWTALKYFDVSTNLLSGTLPSTIEQWTVLTYFDVSYNGLSGTLASTLGQWTALEHFDASLNSLIGTLPSAIGQWTALTYFDVGATGIVANALSGTLPSTIEQWTALTYFDVTSNSFLNGTLPSTIGLWTALTYFDVSANSFSGTIPSWIGNWGYFFDGTAIFQYNQFTGTMPVEICDFTPSLLQVDCTVVCTCCTTDCV